MLMLVLQTITRETQGTDGNPKSATLWRAVVDEPERATPHAVIDGRDRDAVLARALQEYDKAAQAAQDGHERERPEEAAGGETTRAEAAAPAPAKSRLIVPGADDGGGTEPAGAAGAGTGSGAAGPAADREPDLGRRKQLLEAAAGKLMLTDLQLAAVLTASLDFEPVMKQMFGLPVRGRRFAVGMLTLGRASNLFEGRPFWCASVSLRYEDEKGDFVQLKGEGQRHAKDQARASALAHAMLEGVGEWQDHLHVSDDGYVLHRRRTMHEDEVRALQGALLPVMEDEPEPAWEEKAANYRQTIQIAGDHPPEPGIRLVR